jgi:hypothetical protein
MQLDQSTVSDAKERLPPRRGLDRAGFKLIASGLQQCITTQAAGEQPAIDQAQLERLFLSLA